MKRFKKRNPLTSTEDGLLGIAAIGIMALVGYAIYSKQAQASSGAVAPPNPLINQLQSSATTAAAGGFNQGASPYAPSGTTG
jgi:hypothetical protein